MERRLLRGIMNPAMVLSVVFGALTTAAMGTTNLGYWFWIKMAGVAVLLAIHMSLARWRIAFERDENLHSAKFYKICNEVPAVIMVVIVVMVIFKPW
jgi:putative membrane protein